MKAGYLNDAADVLQDIQIQLAVLPIGVVGGELLDEVINGIRCTTKKSPYSQEVQQLGNKIKQWLGENSKMITNKNGDVIFQSENGLKEIRFDVNNFSPHDKPHVHLIEYVIEKTRKKELLNTRYYFVP